MAVVSLGSASRRKSSLSGLSEGLARGLELREKRASRESLEQISGAELEEKRKSRMLREKERENTLSSAMADQSLRKREQDLKNVRQTHDQFSLWWNGLSEQEKATARTSDQYKEFQKFFKSFKNLVPGLISDGGEVVPKTNKDIFRDKLEKRLTQAKLRVANNTATEADVRLIKLEEGGVDLIAEALDFAEREAKRTGDKNPAGILDKVKAFLGRFKKKGKREGQESQVQSPLSPEPTGAASPLTDQLSDPLGILQ